MILSPPPLDPPGPPPPVFLPGSFEALPWVVAALLLSACFALIRASLLYSRTARVVSLARTPTYGRRMEVLLERVEGLSTSAGVMKVICDLFFMALLLRVLSYGGVVGWRPLALAIAIAVPALLLFTESLPHALARRYGDRILLRTLPGFYVLQLPLQLGVVVLVALRKAILRVVGVEEDTSETREFVEELREVIEDTAWRGDLDETERELIENVMDFSDCDVAEIMTPRTEIHGVDVEDGFAAVIQVAAEEGHSRIPVFAENLDNIIGYASARGIVQLLSEEQLEESSLRDHLRPAYFVPETKLVSELLAEFRNQQRKMAIVIDEYGGTAGMVTLGDVLGEIVGDIGDEFDREDPEPVRILGPGLVEIDAGLRIAEVNEALELDLPEEEDYETLGGFVLSELGHLPKLGEAFDRDGAFFEVTEASDRRVICVRITNPKARLGSSA